MGNVTIFKNKTIKFNKKLIGVTYNLTFDKMELLSVDDTPDLNCIEAAKMTSNLPFLFEKCKYNDNYYLDGGIINNFPIDLAKNIGNKILGVVTYNELKKDPKINNKMIENENQLEFIYKLMFVSIDQTTDYRLEILANAARPSIIPGGPRGLNHFRVTNYAQS